ncbi:MAG: DUF5606 family protein [Bacteroidales bacterium]
MKTIKLKDILSISGKGGLFKFVAQARNGIVVESIEDKKRHVAPSTARVSSLEDIAIFTEGEEVPLSDVFYRIHQKADGKETISHKASAEELTAAFQELVPEYDEERVYQSDIRKVFQWYNQLHRNQLLEVVDKKEEGEEVDQEGEVQAPPEEDKKPASGESSGSKGNSKEKKVDD